MRASLRTKIFNTLLIPVSRISRSAGLLKATAPLSLETSPFADAMSTSDLCAAIAAVGQNMHMPAHQVVRQQAYVQTQPLRRRHGAWQLAKQWTHGL